MYTYMYIYININERIDIQAKYACPQCGVNTLQSFTICSVNK